MKLLLSVVLLALFTISFAQQTIPCATEAAQACATSFATCAQGAIDGQTSPCDCFRTYGQCLLGLGCAPNSQEIVNFQLQCQAATCGNDICILAIPTQTIPATTVAQCDATAATACQQAYTTCTQAIATTVNVNQLGDQPQVESTTVATIQQTQIVVPTNQLCTCLETYGTCLRVAGCSSGSFAESFNQICSSSQCAPSVCQTISIGQAVCSSSVVASCQNAFSTCSQHQGSLGLCNCYAAYGTCLTTAGCSGDVLAQFRNQCAAANCNPNICGTTAVLPASCAFCTLTRTECIPTGDDAQLEEICNCFEIERLCLTQNNCTSTSDYQNFLINCRVANCDASVCGPAVVSTCDTQAAAQCAQQFTNCSQLINTQFSLTLSGDNQDILRQQRQALCTCYSTWGVCLRNNNCLSGVEHDAFRQNCQIANCGNDICGTQPVGSPANKVNPKTLWVGISVAALFGISLL